METLIFEQKEQIGVLKVSRPNALNALNRQVMDELDGFLDQVPSGIRCMILTGDGDKAFVAGADIKEMESLTPQKAKALAQKGQRILSKMENHAIPFIAAVNGFALGGGLELALACDFILASDRAKVGLPEVSLGLIPGYGGTQRLSRNIGKSRARFVALTGSVFSAEEGLGLGIFTEVVAHGELLARAEHWARIISQRGPLAVRLARRSLNEGFEKDLTSGLADEAEHFGKIFETKDSREGLSAFTQKRTPQFQGD